MRWRRRAEPEPEQPVSREDAVKALYRGPGIPMPTIQLGPAGPGGVLASGVLSIPLGSLLAIGPVPPDVEKEPPPWPTLRTDRTDPITAWKRANLAWDIDQQRVRFMGCGYPAMYDADDTARHGADGNGGWMPVILVDEAKPHPSPDPTGYCRRCGFYGVDREAAEASARAGVGMMTVEVELFGTIVRHARGHRASRQRVLAGHVDPKCHDCQCQAVGLSFFTRGFCPTCDHCRPPFSRLSLASVSNMVGVELRWGEVSLGGTAPWPR